MTMENRTLRENNLVQSYFDAMRAYNPGIEDADIVDILNEHLAETGDKPPAGYFLQRVYEWRSGTRSIPDPVKAYMMRMALRHVLDSELDDPPELSWSEEERLIHALTPPPRRKPVPDAHKSERTREAREAQQKRQKRHGRDDQHQGDNPA